MSQPAEVVDIKQSSLSLSPSSTSSSGSLTCSIYFETLLEARFKLDEVGQCPACKQMVAYHHHKPYNNNNPSVSISSNANNNNSYTSSSYTNGIRSKLPKWRVDFKSVKPFLDRCQQVFTADNVDPQFWVRLLLRAVEDVSESAWVKVNIVDKGLTWKEAQESFSKHFELYSYSAQLIKDYEQLRQGSKQTVQDYSHKFNRLCAELDYTDDNPLVIQHYLNGLTPERHAAYKKQIALIKLIKGDDSFDTSSLDKVIKLTLELEIVDLNSQAQSPSINDK